jgi:hypothetical protein
MSWLISALRPAALLLFPLLAVGALHAATPDAAKTPILMELFTSEGCSSCPPVDSWAERLDAYQPVAGAQVIVLSEHVNSWDHDGWKDPFSSDQLTARQQGYVTILGLSGSYTPQVIVDGDAELHPWKNEEVKQTLDKAAGEALAPMHIEVASLAGGALTGKIEADGTGEKHGGDVFVAVALNKTQTDVRAGENNGKKLTNVAVVKELVKIGKLEKGRNFDQAFHVKLWPNVDPANLRVVAFVQEPGQGKILGAAMTTDIAKGQ